MSTGTAKRKCAPTHRVDLRRTTSSPLTATVEHQPPLGRLQRALGNRSLYRLLQLKGTQTEPPAVSSTMESYIASTRGGGQPLPESSRSFFEPRFGHDFGGVRLHTDDRAADAARAVDAQAFTTGSDIYFAPNHFDAGSTTGRTLLAHELTHVLQQRGTGNIATLRRQKAGGSSVSEQYSRGNDDQWECCYETAAIAVTLDVDGSVCGKDKDKDKNKKVPASISYAASLGGKTKEADASDPMQGTQEGPDHYLEEQGVKNAKQVKLVPANKGPDIGNSLSATLPLENLPTCGGSSAKGCVKVKGPKTVQQEIKWEATGTTAKSIKANQLVQPGVAGTNRLKSAIPLRAPGGYPKVDKAEPRHKDCWCDPQTGYHFSYDKGPKCPSKYRLLYGKVPKEYDTRKPRPKDEPKVCKVDKDPGKIC